MNRLRELRLERNLTQNELAKLLGITQDSISLWENNRRTPDTAYIVKLCKIFNVTTDYLLGLEDDFGAKTYNVSSVDSPQLTPEEKKLIEDYRKLNFYKQQLIKSNIQAMLPADDTESKQKKNS